MGEAKKRVLIVDDESDLLKLVAKRLEASGFAVMVAMDGQTGLMKAQEHPPDLIILDVMLPKINGFEVCAILKQNSQLRHIPVVIFTAKGQDEDYWRGKAAGADAYLTKPFHAGDLKAVVERLITSISQSQSTSQDGHDAKL